jgi:deoxyadenosine/deoxycytidine kinase
MNVKNFEIISIEGNIGSGKSTLLNNLKRHYANNKFVVFLKEPVDEWEKIKDQNGKTILENFYEDQNKYSFPFQMMAYVSRLKVLREAIKNVTGISETDDKFIFITERSLFTDKMVFAKMLYDTGKIEYINYQIYLNWFDTFSEEFPVHKVIYVKTEPEKCFQRISVRGREGESNIPLAYLESCDIYHNEMLDTNSDNCVCSKQLVLDGNIDIYENNSQIKEWISNIDDFIRC